MERYTKLETIGRGSYAKVLKVKLDSTGEIFAMKVQRAANRAAAVLANLATPARSCRPARRRPRSPLRSRTRAPGPLPCRR
jgi:serine/threonine protein kinase